MNFKVQVCSAWLTKPQWCDVPSSLNFFFERFLLVRKTLDIRGAGVARGAHLSVGRVDEGGLEPVWTCLGARLGMLPRGLVGQKGLPTTRRYFSDAKN